MKVFIFREREVSQSLAVSTVCRLHRLVERKAQASKSFSGSFSCDASRATVSPDSIDSMSDQTEWAHAAMRREATRAREEGRDSVLARRRFADSAFCAENAIAAMGLPAVMDGLRQCHFRDRLLLARLKQLLASGEDSPDDFFLSTAASSSAETTPLSALVSLLSGSAAADEGNGDSSGSSSSSSSAAALQLLAAQVVANLAPLHEKHGLLLARSAGPFLITLLASGSTRLRESSCVALGNLALAGAKVVRVLVNQEVVESLLVATECGEESVRSAAFYALYHVLHTCPPECVEGGALERLVAVCKGQLELAYRAMPIELPWVLFVLSCNHALHGSLNTRAVVTKALDICTYEIFQKSDSRPLVRVVTPVVRLLANLCSGPGSESASMSCLAHPDLQAILMALLATNYSHLCKESLWWFANIVNSESVVVQEHLVELDIMDKLEFHTVQAVQKMDPYLSNVMH